MATPTAYDVPISSREPIVYSPRKPTVANTWWADSFTEVLDLPETAESLTRLAQLTKDFVKTAEDYAKLIVAEQYKEQKTIEVSNIGGFAGGVKYVHDGIIFKLCTDRPISARNYASSGYDSNGYDSVQEDDHEHDDEPNNTTFFYGGHCPRYDLAGKASKHDLLGAQKVCEALTCLSTSHNVRIPVQILLEYRGFRITAQPLLDLHSNVLYGSADAGQTVNNAAPFTEVIAHTAEVLHLARHQIRGSHIQLCLGGDVEGRVERLRNDRFWLLDLARTFPCEGPTEHLPSTGRVVFYRMLRPELLQQLKNENMPPLSSDTFTGWCHEDDAKEFEQRSHQATSYLINTVIPQCVKSLNGELQADEAATLTNDDDDNDDSNTLLHQKPKQQQQSLSYAQLRPRTRGRQSVIFAVTSRQHLHVVSDVKTGGELNRNRTSSSSSSNAAATIYPLEYPVSDLLHKYGINMRHIGLVRSKCIHAAHREVLLIEIVSRTLKHILRQQQRECAIQSLTSRTSEYAMKNVIVTFLNLVSGFDRTSFNFWVNTVYPQIIERFGTCALYEMSSIHVKHQKSISREKLLQAVSPLMLNIIPYTLYMVGVRLTAACYQDLSAHMDKKNEPSFFVFTGVDLEDQDVRIKAMSLLEYPKAYLLKHQADSTYQREASLRLLRLAMEACRDILASNPLFAPAQTLYNSCSNEMDALQLRTPVGVAIARHDVDFVKRALSSMAVHVNTPCILDEKQDTALHAAARIGDLDIVKVLITANASIENRNRDDHTALQVASDTCQPEIFRHLLQLHIHNQSIPNSMRLSITLPLHDKQDAILKCLAATICDANISQVTLGKLVIVSSTVNHGIPSDHDDVYFKFGRYVRDHGSKNLRGMCFGGARITLDMQYEGKDAFFTVPNDAAFGSIEACFLAGYLDEHPTLTELNLNDNKLGLTGAVALGKVLCTCKKLRKITRKEHEYFPHVLRGMDKTAIDVNLSHCHLQSEDILLFSFLLAENTQCIILNLSHNDISSVGCAALVPFVTNNLNLSQINLLKNKRLLGTRGVEQLQAALTNRDVQILAPPT